MCVFVGVNLHTNWRQKQNIRVTLLLGVTLLQYYLSTRRSENDIRWLVSQLSPSSWTFDTTRRLVCRDLWGSHWHNIVNVSKKRWNLKVTLSPQSTSNVTYAYSLDPDEPPGNSAVSSGSKLFDTRTTFSPTLSDIEALWRLKQTRNLEDDILCGGLTVRNTPWTYKKVVTCFRSSSPVAKCSSKSLNDGLVGVAWWLQQ